MIKDIPQIGLGTWMVTKKQVAPVIKAALEAGYTHIDTASAYRNEREIGKALKDNDFDRSNMFLTSKVMNFDYKGNAVTKVIDLSLKRLGVDQMDLYLLHTPFSKKEVIVHAYKKLIEAREAGKIKRAGVANFSIEHLKWIKEATGEYPYVNQFIITPTARRVELEKFCKENGILITGYSTLRSYFDPNPFYEGSGMSDEQKAYIQKVAKNHSKDVGRVLTRWAMQNGYTVIPKSVKPSRVTSNFDLESFKLTAAEMKEINSWNTLAGDKIMEKFANNMSKPIMKLAVPIWKAFLR